MKEALALAVLAASLSAAIARTRWAPEWLLASLGVGLLLLTGTVRGSDLHSELRELGPTIGLLAALLVLAEGCAQAGLFEALGTMMGHRAGASSHRLLAMVFLTAAATTAVLSLDATVILLTPVVLVTVQRLRVPPRPHLIACAHLANSASLLLPVSNLTNLLAFQATHLPFARFAALMALPWLGALAIEWLVLTHAFRGDLSRAPRAAPPPDAPVELSRSALAVLIATLAGFGLSSTFGIAPVWIGVGGAAVLAVRQRIPAPRLVIAAQPLFLLFVLALGVIVRGAGAHGLSSVIGSVLPHGDALADLLGVAAVSALIANLVNNLPATLIVLPVVAGAGPPAVLAMLIGVGAGPNLTYAGSLATLLWRRVLRAHGQPSEFGVFHRLGLLVVPPILLGGTLLLWLALKVI